MENRYKKAIDEVRPSSNLKHKTILAMKNTKLQATPPAKVMPFSKKAMSIAAALVVLLASFGIVRWYSNNNIINTTLPNVGYVEEVTIKNGSLFFENRDATLQIVPILPDFGATGTPVVWSLEEYYVYLGRSLESVSIPKDFTKSDEAIKVIQRFDEDSILSDNMLMVFRGSGTRRITIGVSVKGIPTNGAPRDSFNSAINDIPVYVGASPKEEIFYAQYQENGATYVIETKGLTQEEFIKLLYSFFS